MDNAVEMKHITKRFGKLCANNDISIEIKRNSIHGIIGENGAGKTTLMKILYGMYSMDEGEIFIFGNKVSFHSPKDAIEKRVGMIHQHFTLVPSMSILDNVVLGRPPCRFGIVDRKKAEKEVRQLCERCNFDMNPGKKVQDLPVGLKQRVEILKALYLGADILIMDEPTAVLTPQEITGLFDTLREIRNQGASIILITHKLSEVMDVTDHITVLRDGRVTGNVLTKEINEIGLSRMMVGRDVLLNVDKGQYNPGETVLDIKNVSCKNSEGIMAVNDVSLQVRRGEIVGIAGVQGNGQTELQDVISGMNEIYSGSIRINGHEVKQGATPLERRRMGLGYIPEDRQVMGSAGMASIEDNFIMTLHRLPEMDSHGFLGRSKGEKLLQKQIDSFKIKTKNVKAEASSLSGGNMQKLIVAREYSQNPEVLVAAQPTRGVDIGATEFIHKKLVEMRDNHNGVLLISNELSEIMSLSDRILVMYGGRIVGEVRGKDATETQLGLWMAGITSNREKGDEQNEL